jgi:hypothetical protein
MVLDRRVTDACVVCGPSSKTVGAWRRSVQVVTRGLLMATNVAFVEGCGVFL